MKLSDTTRTQRYHQQWRKRMTAVNYTTLKATDGTELLADWDSLSGPAKDEVWERMIASEKQGRGQ